MWWISICLSGSDIGPSYQPVCMWWISICLSGSDIGPSYQPVCMWHVVVQYLPFWQQYWPELPSNVQRLDFVNPGMSVFLTTLKENIHTQEGGKPGKFQVYLLFITDFMVLQS